MSVARRITTISLIIATVALVIAAGLWFTRVSFSLTDGRALRASPSDAPPRQSLWEPPTALADWPLSSFDEYEPHIAPDGATLLLVRNRAGANADIYISHRSPDGWSEPEPLSAINTDADELSPELARDGRTLIFSSNRESPGAFGGFDLYRSTLVDGAWTAPENLGPAFNSPWNEHDPALTPDSATLYFSSNRPREDAEPSADGRAWPATIRQDIRAHDYDIYLAQRDSQEQWRAAPLTAVNTPHNDGAAAVSPAGDFLYFASDRPRGRGGLDIYRIRIEPPGDWSVENLGAPVNTAANELDPALTAHGFALNFASDRDPESEGASRERYALYESISREVYRDIDFKPIDWAALWSILAPWLLWILLALLLALLLLLLARLLSDARWKGRWRALSLLARCLILSALVHLLLLALFTIWQVSSAITSLLDGRGQTQIAFISSDTGAGIESQLLAPMTDIPAPTIEAQRSRAEPTIPTQSTLPDPLRADVQSIDAPDALDFTMDTPASEVAMTSPSPEAPPAHPSQPELTTPTSAQRAAVAESQAQPLPIESAQPTTPAPPQLTAAPAPTRFEAQAETLTAADQAQTLTIPSPAAPLAQPTPTAQPPIATTAALDVSLPAQHEAQRATAEPSAQTNPTASAALPRATPQVTASPALDATIELAPASVEAQEHSEASATPAQPSAPPTLAARPSQPPPSSTALTDIALPASAQRTPQSAEASAPLTAPPASVASARPSPSLPSTAEPLTRIATTPQPSPITDAPPRSAPAVTVSSLASAPHPAQLAPPPTPRLRADLDSLALPTDSASPPQRAEADPAPAQPAPTTFSPTRPAIALSGTPDAPPAPLTLTPAIPDVRDPQPSRSALSVASPPLPTSTTPSAARLASLDLPSALPNLPIPEDPAPTIYPQRAPEARQVLVEKGGGGRETEEAVQRSLAWLARAQHPDGSWNGRDFDHACADCDGRASYEFQSAMTGLALLCFLGADNTHIKDGPYQHTVRRGLDFLLARQSSSGDLRAGETLYSHGIASIALAEAYGMTRDPALADPVQRAIDFIAASRSRRHGGWRYEPRQAGDTSVLGWQIMALESARRCGVNVPADAINEARAWLARVSTPDAPGLYAYQPFGKPTESMTAEGLFVRQLVGAGANDDSARASVQFIMRNMPRWRGDSSAGATYYWYYATLALYQHSGEEWGRWNSALMPILLERQRTDGDAAGSWDPSDRWSEIGGRIYQTALCTLMLEVYYRYLPTYLTAAHPEPPSPP